jgi:ornithine cyclodeaminase
MIKIFSCQQIQDMVSQYGLEKFNLQLVSQLENDFCHWQDFSLTPRHATHYPHGVIELMPTSSEQRYAVKYVNGHPENPKKNKLNVIALGILADTASGYPMMICDMTLLTAFRTAATSALATKYLMRDGSDTIAIIGTGAQSEFQILALHYVTGIKTVRYFDIDPDATEKFSRNLAPFNLDLIACNSIEEAVDNADIIATATASKSQQEILNSNWIKPGTFINAIGGDCPGKTELPSDLVAAAKVVVEFLPQTKIEGEIQNLENQDNITELWQIISGAANGRENQDEVIIFDSVGSAIEDYSALNLIYLISEQQKRNDNISILPSLSNPKDLFSLMNKNNITV